IDELAQILPTLRSRLQVLRFQPLSDDEIRSGKDLPEWIVHSARGSLERLENFQNQENEEMRLLTFEFLSGALSGKREALNTLHEHIKDRESALTAIRFLQQMLRDWSVTADAQMIHSD